MRRRVIAIFHAWQSGKIVRAAYSAKARHALTPAVAKSMSKTLKAFGPLYQAAYQSSYHKDGDDFYLYAMTCKNGVANMSVGFTHDGQIDYVAFRQAIAGTGAARVADQPSTAPSATPAPSPVPSASPSAQPSPAARPLPTPTPAPAAAPSDSPASPPPATPSAHPTFPPTPQPPTLIAALADPETRPLLGGPIRQLAHIRWMAGTWRARDIRSHVNGKQTAGANTYIFAYTMKGRWIFGADGTLTDFIYLTYDPLGERWVLLQLEKYPSYGIWTSAEGWQHGRIVFEGEPASALGRAFRRRFTIIHRDLTHMAIVAEEQRPDGSWITDERIELAKQS